MSGKAGKGRSGVKSREDMNGKDMLRRMRKMEMEVKALKEKMKKGIQKEREKHRREMQNAKRKMKKHVKGLKEKMKKDIQKERAKHRRETCNTKERCTQQNIITLSYVVLLREELNTRITNLAESSTHDNTATRTYAAQIDQQLHWQSTRITNLAVKWNETMQHEIRRRHEQTSSVRWLQQDFRHIVSSIRP